MGHQNLAPRPLYKEMTSLQAAEPEAPARDGVRIGLPERTLPDFEAVYRENFRFVWRSVRRLGTDEFFVDDVVQETFLVVHRRLGEFEGRSSMKTWLYGSVRRVVADHRRTLRRKPALAGATASGGDVDTLSDVARCAPDASVEQSEQVQLLHRLLGLLDDEKREAFVLSELEGMTMAEIAEALDVNPNTISSRLRAARREFEEALERATREEERAGTMSDKRAR
jgi:RNA polymerase sigma-70 factor (ECF subfamily)